MPLNWYAIFRGNNQISSNKKAEKLNFKAQNRSYLNSYNPAEPFIKSRHSREACPVLDTGKGIQKDIAGHDFWIPTYVGMTKILKNNTYDTKPSGRERKVEQRYLFSKNCPEGGRLGKDEKE
jgi:hypothetical protein